MAPVGVDDDPVQRFGNRGVDRRVEQYAGVAEYFRGGAFGDGDDGDAAVDGLEDAGAGEVGAVEVNVDAGSAEAGAELVGIEFAGEEDGIVAHLKFGDEVGEAGVVAGADVRAAGEN